MLTTHIVSIFKELTEAQISTREMQFGIQGIAVTASLNVEYLS